MPYSSQENKNKSNRDISNVNIEMNNSNEVAKRDRSASLKKDTKFYKIPYQLSTRWCVFILILNIFLPGIGTIVMGCSLIHAGMKPEDASAIRCFYYGSGALQLLLAAVIVGWVWSIMTGCYLVEASMNNESKTSGDVQ